MRALFSENCEYLPIWKQGATAEERFLELAAVAAKHPEWFEQMTLIYVSHSDDGRTTTRYAGVNSSTQELLGMLRMCEWEIMNTTRK